MAFGKLKNPTANKIILILFFSYALSGCASVKEATKFFFGISTKEIEDTRKDAIRKTFNYEQTICYNKVKKFLAEKGFYIYSEDKRLNMIALFVSEEDTTPVGVFFKQVDSQNTQLEVSSPATYAKELVAQKVFGHLEGEDEK